MSAFIVSPEHVSALVTYAIANRVSYYGFKAKASIQITETNASVVGAELLAENVKSVSYRYSGRIDREEKRAAKNYVFNAHPGDFDHSDIIAACRCLDYQSCEHAGWARSQAREILNCIVTHAAVNLASDSAVWEIA